jgi:hypothetical protein
MNGAHANDRLVTFPYNWVTTRPGARILRPVLQEWISCTEKYAWFTGDLSYSHTERANVGMLGAAAWKAGWLALEEYSGPKAAKGLHEKTGRVDLFLMDQKGSSIVVEAKCEWWNASNDSRREALGNRLREALEDVRKNRDDVGGRKRLFGAVFAVMRVPVRQQKQLSWQQHISLFHADIRSVGADAVAICFPPFGRRLTSQPWAASWPGVALLLKETGQS